MHAWALVRTLTVNELKHVRRDSLLRWMAAMPVILSLLLRWAVPAIDANITFDLQPYYVLIMSAYAVFGVPVIIGFIVGMLLLDDRDDGTLQAMRVTPLTLERYLIYKLTLPVLVSTVLTIACIPLTGLMAQRIAFVPACLVGALWAPILALLMASFARNKLQGFVLMRVSNILVAVPMVAWFVPSRWESAFGVLPAYWSLKAFWQAADGGTMWPYVVVGAIMHVVCLGWFVRHFRRVLSRE